MTCRRGTCWSRSRWQNVVELEVALTIPKTFLLEKVSVLVFTGRGTWRKGSPKAALRPWIRWPWQRQKKAAGQQHVDDVGNGELGKRRHIQEAQPAGRQGEDDGDCCWGSCWARRTMDAGARAAAGSMAPAMLLAGGDQKRRQGLSKVGEAEAARHGVMARRRRRRRRDWWRRSPGDVWTRQGAAEEFRQ